MPVTAVLALAAGRPVEAAPGPAVSPAGAQRYPRQMRPPPTSRADRIVAGLAVAGLVAGGLIIAAQRARTTQFVYVSGLGAQGSQTAEWFRWGFVCVVAGLAGVAWTLRDVHSRGSLLDLWRPALSLVVATGCFLVASQVNCSAGCPLAFTPAAAARDAVHIVAAVLGFAAGAWAMLQLATATDRWLARISALSGVLVAVIAGAGGLLSLFGANTDLGSTLEYIATGIGLAWLVTVTVVHVRQGPATVVVGHRASAPRQPPADPGPSVSSEKVSGTTSVWTR